MSWMKAGAGHLGDQVAARHRLADHLVGRGCLRPRAAGDVLRRNPRRRRSSSSRGRSGCRPAGRRRPRRTDRPARSSAAGQGGPGCGPCISALTRRTDRPDTSMDWLELVEPSSGASAVSPDRMSMRSRATSSSSAAICDRAISTPWPISTLPTASLTVRSGWNRSHFSSRRLFRMLRGSVSLMRMLRCGMRPFGKLPFGRLAGRRR